MFKFGTRKQVIRKERKLQVDKFYIIIAYALTWIYFYFYKYRCYIQAALRKQQYTNGLLLDDSSSLYYQLYIYTIYSFYIL